ncbi:MAG TPA: hypothetical protein VGV61_05505 [Thermoanaerobaculia bacterium]|jgi:hypothetical protein|nr:hypothetical protein [Thermoanaerobaculia bacterium]
MRRFLALLALVLPLVAAPAHAQLVEGPQLTAARQLDLAAQHLASAVLHAAGEAQVSTTDAAQIAALADTIRDFRFELEANSLSSLQAEAAWAEVSHLFVAARSALADSKARDIQHEMLRVNALMNRIDRGFGGTGFWSGRNGWGG